LTRERQSYDDKEATLADKNGGALLAAETLRSAAQPPPAAEAPRTEERISVFWRVFGGTLLSIAALVIITVYNQFSTTLADLRKELNQLYENRAELLRKDEFNNRLNSVWAGMKDLQGAAKGLAALDERAKLLEQQLERQARNAEEDRKELCRKLDEQRKAAEEDRKEAQRRLEEQRKLAESVRGELVRQLQDQRRSFDEDRKELARQIQLLGERLVKVEARMTAKQ
jgi:hypothetical protein